MPTTNPFSLPLQCLRNIERPFPSHPPWRPEPSGQQPGCYCRTSAAVLLPSTTTSSPYGTSSAAAARPPLAARPEPAAPPLLAAAAIAASFVAAASVMAIAASCYATVPSATVTRLGNSPCRRRHHLPCLVARLYTVEFSLVRAYSSRCAFCAFY